jgi:hypothetical protein
MIADRPAIVLSERTTRALSDAFRKVADTTLVRNAGDLCEIAPAGVGGDAVMKHSPSVLLITLSSFLFRLVTVFQMAEDAETRGYFLSGSEAGRLEDNFAEQANMLCGALSRELTAQFRHLAMSIPYRLESQVTGFLQELQPQHQVGFDVTINHLARLRVVLCLICSRPIEFTCDPGVSHSGGELELF